MMCLLFCFSPIVGGLGNLSKVYNGLNSYFFNVANSHMNFTHNMFGKQKTLVTVHTVYSRAVMAFQPEEDRLSSKHVPWISCRKVIAFDFFMLVPCVEGLYGLFFKVSIYIQYM